jgi:hypothetical protein
MFADAFFIRNKLAAAPADTSAFGRTFRGAELSVVAGQRRTVNPEPSATVAS